MTGYAVFLLCLYFIILLLLTQPIGAYMARVFSDQPAVINRLGKPIESLIYRVGGIKQRHEMGWKEYAFSVLCFNLLGVLALYLLQRFQFSLPLNPEHLQNVSPDSALNTAISFATNTNWQGYAGERSMSYLTQMSGLAVQNFFSGATAICVVIVLIRGFIRHDAHTLGNFWVDITRTVLYILLPLSFVLAILLMSQGVIQNFNGYEQIDTLQTMIMSPTTSTQTIPMGPVASQEAIKILGTNGGGFFNANSAHPFENPTGFSNFLQVLAIFLIPAGLCYTFGILVNDKRQGWAIFTAMSIIFIAMTCVVLHYEQQGNPLLTVAGADQIASHLQAGGNMEGKECRFGITASSIFAAVTTATSCGAVNAMHDSFTPMGGMVPMGLMQLDEVVFGGVGSGLYGMLIFAILAVFIAGLMIGRTPEYLGKKIESFDIKMVAIAILIIPMLALVGSAITLLLPAGKAGILNPGAHGLSEVLYAFLSSANNNGSAFAGLSTNTPFYNILLAMVMWFGRFLVIVPILAIAASLASKKKLAPTSGTFQTHGLLFIVLLISTVILIGSLTYLPALVLGPLAEQLTWR